MTVGSRVENKTGLCCLNLWLLLIGKIEMVGTSIRYIQGTILILSDFNSLKWFGILRYIIRKIKLQTNGPLTGQSNAYNIESASRNSNIFFTCS